LSVIWDVDRLISSLISYSAYVFFYTSCLPNLLTYSSHIAFDRMNEQITKAYIEFFTLMELALYSWINFHFFSLRPTFSQNV